MNARRVVVVGAGPAGTAAAMEVAAQGVECILLERKTIPRTKACGSGLSPWTLRLLDDMGVGQSVRKLAFRIDGAIIAGVEGEGLELRGDHETAVLRRAEFDELLALEARRRGADVRDGISVTGLERHRGDRSSSTAIHTTDGTVEADLVIDAAGATGRLDRYLDETEASAPSRAPTKETAADRMTLHTIMGWYEGVSGCSDVVELFFDRELRPHYAWIFPETERRVNIGLCFKPTPDGPNARDHFESFIERRLSDRLRGADALGRWIGHPVRVSSSARDLVADGMLRAGEAGWLADCATAEGIYHALVSGRIAGRFAAARLQSQARLEADELRDYERANRKELGLRLRMGRVLMSGLTTPFLDWALKLRKLSATRAALSKAFTGFYHG